MASVNRKQTLYSILPGERRRGRRLQTRKLALGTLFDNASVGLFQATPSGWLLRANKAAASLLGFATPDVLLDQSPSLFALFPTLPLLPLPTPDKTPGSEDTPQSDRWVAENVFVGADGKNRRLRATIQVIRDVTNHPAYLDGALDDVTELYQAMTALQQSNERYRRLFKSNPLPTWMFDPMTLHILAVNDAAQEEYGYTREEFLQMRLTDLHPPGEMPSPDDLQMPPRSSSSLQQSNIRHWRKDRTLLDVDIYRTQLILEEGTTVYLDVACNVTEWREAERRLSWLAYHDTLTQLPNRNAFLEWMIQTIGAVESTFSEGFLCTLSVLLIHLNNFKRVNDVLGHRAGDELLQQAAQRLALPLPKTARLARLTEDEFAVLLPLEKIPATDSRATLSPSSNAVQVARNLLQTLDAPFEVAGQEMLLSARVGITCYPNDGRDGETLLKNAGSAVRRLRSQRHSGVGRGAFALYHSEVAAEASQQLRLEAELSRALERKELLVYYQPVVRAKDLQLQGYEALVRWQHPQDGLISPGQFIPVAEETGLILPLGEWVLWTACDTATKWQQTLPRPSVSINLSARQFFQSDLSAFIQSVLNYTGLPAECLVLEITESTLMDGGPSALDVIERLRDKGIRIALDDFGTGYSSLWYLRHFPVDILKIDRSFVQALPEQTKNYALVAALIELAHALELHVTAEGIETEAQADSLRQMGCDSFQGYLFGKPTPL